MQLKITNGTIVTPFETLKADIGIANDKITAIGDLSTLSAEKTLDARGMYVFPGIIDVHTHFETMGGGGVKTADNFFTGTRAAALGGVTTIIDFTKQEKGEFVKEAVHRRYLQARDQVCIDFGLHSLFTDLSQDSFNAIPDVVMDGYSTLKLFTTYKKTGFLVEDGELLETIRKAHASKGMVILHAENDALCEYYTQKNIAEGKLSPEYHPLSRPNITEEEAVSKAALFAKHTKSLLYIVHLTTAEGADIIKQSRSKGVQIMAETCPQYLVLTDDKYLETNGHYHIATPPLRKKTDQDKLWEGIQEGSISVVSTDHCSFTTAQKDKGKESFKDVPPGIPGTETLLPLMHHFGVNHNRISLNKLVEVLCHNPAKIFGMYPNKGTLIIGTDADIVIFDPNKKVRLGTDTLHMGSDYSPYEGIEVQGYPSTTILRGNIIVENGQFLGEKGFGQFIRRKQPQYV